MSATAPDLWRHRDFLSVWAAAAISALGSRFSREGLPMVAVMLLAASPEQLGWLGALTMLPSVLLSPAAGALVDRWDRRRLLIIADLGRAALLLAIPAAAWLGQLSMVLLIAVAAGVATLSMLFEIADRAFLPGLVGRAALLDANTKLSTTDAVAEAAGPALAGLVVAALGAPLAIVVDAASYLGSAALIGRVRPGPAPAERRDDEATENGSGSLSPTLKVLLASTAISHFFGGFFVPLYVLFALRELALGPALLGLTIGMGGIGGFAGAALMRPLSRRIGTWPLMVMTRLAGVMFSALIPLASGSVALATACLIAAQLLGDSAMTVFSITETTLRQQLIPDASQGRINATFHLTGGLLVALGALAGGALAAPLGTRATLWIAVAGSLASVPVLAGGLLADRRGRA